MNTILIRVAETSDIPQLASIHVLAWNAAYSGAMPDEVLDELNVERRTQDWQGWLANPGPGTTFVIEQDGVVVGFSVFGPTRDEDVEDQLVGEILAINIHPDYWGKGLGKHLCLSILEVARQRQWCRLTLWTLVSNERAHSFYQSLGFERDGCKRENEALTGCVLSEVRYQKIIQACAE